MEIHIDDEKKLKEVAEKLKENIARNDSKTAIVIALKGDLGAGKTTFTKYFAELLGIKETVSSPTFVIERIYDINFARFKRFVHIDAYRIEDERELKDLGFEELLGSRENLVIIEWPEKVEKIIPKDTITVLFEYGQKENERKITIKNTYGEK